MARFTEKKRLLDDGVIEGTTDLTFQEIAKEVVFHDHVIVSGINAELQMAPGCLPQNFRNILWIEGKAYPVSIELINILRKG
jgi:hypothetical protein